MPDTSAHNVPAFTPVQLATPATRPPAGDQWTYELKLDGWRVQIAIGRGTARLYSRNGKDLTRTFPVLAKHASRLPFPDTVLDGELVAVDADGVSRFSALQAAISGDQSFLQIYAFDLLRLNGSDMRKLTLRERRDNLEKLFQEIDPHGPIRLSETFEYSQRLWDTIVAMRHEGLIAKQMSSRYSGGRSPSWLKLKTRRDQEFVIGGFVPGDRPVGALLVGYFDNGELRYAGKVGTGFSDASAKALRAKLDPLSRPSCPLARVPRAEARGAQWVDPALVCQLTFAEWTASDHLRHASFKGLREDKDAADVVRED